MFKCTDCGKIAICFYNDVEDEIYFVDRYCLYCPACGLTKYSENLAAGKKTDKAIATNCPFCKALSYDHILLPQVFNKAFNAKQPLH